MSLWSRDYRPPTLEEVLEAEKIEHRPPQHFVSEEESNDPLRLVKVEIAGILCASQRPMLEHEILLDYSELNGPLDPRKWGFNSFTALMLKCNDRFLARKTRSGQYEFTLIPNERTTSLRTLVQNQLSPGERRNRSRSRGDRDFRRDRVFSSSSSFEREKSASSGGSFASHFLKELPQGAQMKSPGREWTDEFDEGRFQRGEEISSPVIPTREVTQPLPAVHDLSRSTSRSTSPMEDGPLLFSPRKVELISGLLECYGTRLSNGDYELEMVQLRSRYNLNSKKPLAGGGFDPRVTANRMACFVGAPWVIEVELSAEPGTDHQYFVILKNSNAETSLGLPASSADFAERHSLAHSPSAPFRVHLTRELVDAASIKYPAGSVPASFFCEFVAKSASGRINADAEGAWTREEIMKIGRKQLGSSLPSHIQDIIVKHRIARWVRSPKQQRVYHQDRSPVSGSPASGNSLSGNEVASQAFNNPAVSTSVLEKTTCEHGSSSFIPSPGSDFPAQETVEKTEIAVGAGLLIERTEKFIDVLMHGKEMSLEGARLMGVEEVVLANSDLFHVTKGINTTSIGLSRQPPYDFEKLVLNALRKVGEAAADHQAATLCSIRQNSPEQSDGQNEDVADTHTSSSMEFGVSLGVDELDSDDEIITVFHTEEEKNEYFSERETASKVESSISPVFDGEDSNEVTEGADVKREVDSDEETITQMESFSSVDGSKVDSDEDHFVPAAVEAAQPSSLASLHKFNPFIFPNFFTRPLDSISHGRLIMASLMYSFSAKTLLLCDTTNKADMEERGERLQTAFRELYWDVSSWIPIGDPLPGCLAVAVSTDNEQYIRVILLQLLSEPDCWLTACLDTSALVGVHRGRLLHLDESRFGLEQEPASIFRAQVRLQEEDIPGGDQWLSFIVEKVNEGADMIVPSFSAFIYMDEKVQSYKVEMLLRWQRGKESARDGEEKEENARDGEESEGDGEESREFLSGLLHRFLPDHGRCPDRIPPAVDFLKFEKRVLGVNDVEDACSASAEVLAAANASTSRSPSQENLTDIIVEFNQLIERAKKTISCVQTEGALRAIALLDQAVEEANH